MFSENKKVFLQLGTLSVAMLLASCGGDGSGSLGFSPLPGGSTPTTPTTPGNGTSVSAVNISAVQLTDASGQSTRTIAGNGAVATVKVTDAAGLPIPSAIVTFTSDGVTFGTTNGAVLTDTNGMASISVKPAASNDTGSYQLTAAVSHNGLSATTAPYNFSLQAANIVIRNMMLSDSNLESGGNTNITLKTQDATTGANQNDVTVNFSASCGTFSAASVVSSNQGDVTTTYRAIDTAGKLCEGQQTISATTANNASVSQSLPVTIAAVAANSLIYNATDPVRLGTRNSGSSTSGQIEFTVFANGTPAANQDVVIDLLRGPADLSFISLGNRQSRTVRSDASGKVVVNLYPGSLPGPVEIKATLASNPNVTALSKDVAVATGRAYQSGLSLAFSKNALNTTIDGDATTIQARMADRVGNSVPDGTVISFVTEGGRIDPNCATRNGECEVKLIVQNPRPSDSRITVLAFVEGDKAYTDINGDNSFISGVDTLISNIGDFFRDDNENNQYDAGEFVYRRGASGATCANSSLSQPNIPGTCNGELDSVLRVQSVVTFSSNAPTYQSLSPDLNFSQGFIVDRSGSQDLFFQIFGNSSMTVPLPSGSQVSVTAVDNTAANSVTCSAELIEGNLTTPDVSPLATIADFASPSNSLVRYRLRLKDCDPGDDIKLSVQTSNQLTTEVLTVR